MKCIKYQGNCLNLGPLLNETQAQFNSYPPHKADLEYCMGHYDTGPRPVPQNWVPPTGIPDSVLSIFFLPMQQ